MKVMNPQYYLFLSNSERCSDPTAEGVERAYKERRGRSKGNKVPPEATLDFQQWGGQEGDSVDVILHITNCWYTCRILRIKIKSYLYPPLVPGDGYSKCILHLLHCFNVFVRAVDFG